MGWLEDLQSEIAKQLDFQGNKAKALANGLPTTDDLNSFSAQSGVSTDTAKSWFQDLNIECCCCCCP